MSTAPPLPPPPPGVGTAGAAPSPPVVRRVGSGRKHSAKRTEELYQNAAAKREKVEALRKQLEAECTFKPKLNSAAGGGSTKGASGDAKKGSRARGSSLYASGVAAREAREARAAATLDKECTFSPSLKKGGRVKKGSTNSSPVVPAAGRSSSDSAKTKSQPGSSRAAAPVFNRLYNSSGSNSHAARRQMRAAEQRKQTPAGGSGGAASEAPGGEAQAQAPLTLTPQERAARAAAKERQRVALARLHNPAGAKERAARHDRLKQEREMSDCTFMPNSGGDTTATTPIDVQGTFNRLFEDAEAARARLEEKKLHHDLLHTTVHTFQPDLSGSFAGAPAERDTLQPPGGSSEGDAVAQALASDRLFRTALESKHKQQERIEKLAKEQCPFKPKINSQSSDLIQARSDPSRKADTHERLYKGGREKVERVKARAEAARRKREQDNLDQCTFRPSLNPSANMPSPRPPALSPTERPPWSSNTTPDTHTSPVTLETQLAAAAADAVGGAHGSPGRAACLPGGGGGEGGTPPMRNAAPLSAALLERLGAKLRAAAYTAGGMDLSALFKRFDDNNDGRLSAEELTKHLVKIMPGALSAGEAEQLCGAFDTDGSGFVDREEFEHFCTVGAGAHAARAQSLEALERELLETADDDGGDSALDVEIDASEAALAVDAHE